MQLTLIKKKHIYSVVLPEKIKGQYWVRQTNESGDEEKVISVEANEGKWILKSNKNASIVNDKNSYLKEQIVEPLNFYSINLNSTNEKVLLYSEPVTENRKHFSKFNLPRQGKILIGREKECDISYSNTYTSSKHAEFIINEGRVIIKDLSSTNGTFVNGIRIEEKELIPGDVIYIVGLKLVFSKGIIAINNPDKKVTCNNAILKQFERQTVLNNTDEEELSYEQSNKTLFYRSPRFKKDIDKKEIKLDPPPSTGNREETPLMFILGPSMTMGLTSLFTGLLTLQNVMRTNGDIMAAMPTLMMSFSMLLGTVLWPILTKRYEKKKRIEYERLRQEKYLRYIESKREEIAIECKHQSEILHENFISIDQCISRIKNVDRNLWERVHGQNDFLKVRLGIGDLPLVADIKHPEKRFAMDDDNLRDELYRLVEEPKLLKQVPITLSFLESYISGIIGKRDEVVNFARGLIFQLAALHSYDELKLVFIYDKKEKESWDAVKWLPHVWNDDKTVRFVATNSNEVKELSAYVEKEVLSRETITSQEELNKISPHYIVFAMSKNLAGNAEMVDLILKHKKNFGFSLINLYDELKDLPKECSMIVELNNEDSKIYDKNDITGQYTSFNPDIYLNYDSQDLAVALANTQLDTSAQAYKLPDMLTFLDMFEVGKIEHLNALTRWKENDPTITLEAPIGVNTSGELFNLDLHEKFHGPHGLIAGMTGSGKSEFIMTFILSLAVSYHPDEIAFILIDYKGGGMANTFENLPHLAGTITNLDGAAVNRSLVSIQSELKRRQAIFSETSKRVNVSNIDIYKYQKLYREGRVSEPLQHLFIISDEFAELKTQQPEFMEQLVSAARIGRSLGVHLILATQKPSGVVDDQIWSNSKFRICLKVQEKADSMEVIKRPDAAELSTTGRFYVQVGFNELFELGQSAWGGAPYYPTDRIENKVDDSVVIVDNLGRIVKQVKPDKRQGLVKNPPKQIDETIKYLEELAKEEDIRVRPLWLEPIPAMIYLDELKRKYNDYKVAKGILNPVIGEIDDPANQRQMIMRLPMTSDGNVIVYGAAGSGKTTFLTTLIYSLIEDHTPAELNMYILDFGSETLRSFSKAPHVGDVLLSHESEKMTNLFKMLNGEINKRRKIFADYGGDHQSYMKATNEDIPSIVVMIHNYSAFAETYEEMEETIAYLTREGLKYGIYFVVTALNTGAIRYRILQNFKQLYVLQLNDETDYSGVLGNVNGVYPSKHKGRGIFKLDGVFEFQTAHISKKAENTLEFVRNHCREYSERCNDVPAKKVPILPNKVDAYYLENEIKHEKDHKIPIGVEKNSLNIAYYDFNNSYINLVLSQDNENAAFIQGLAEVMNGKGDSEIIVIDPTSMFEEDEDKQYKYENSELDSVVVELFNTIVHRNNTYKDVKEQGLELPSFDKVTCIIHSLSDLMDVISEDSKDKLKLFLEKGDKAYNINFIICDNVDSISLISYENWFREQVSSSDGIWLGNGIADQFQLKPSKVTNDMYGEIGDNFGYIVNKGKVKLIKLLSSVTRDTEVESDG